MSFKRHTALDLTAVATQLISSIPTTDDLLLTLRGATTLGAVDHDWIARLNNDSGNNYHNAGMCSINGAAPVGMADTIERLRVGRHTDAADHTGVFRISKVGTKWVMAGTSGIRRTTAAVNWIITSMGWWDSAGVALSSLMLRWDNGGAGSGKFTGRVELWYQDA